MVAPDQLRPRDQPTCLAPRHRPAVAICPLEACAPGIGVHPCAPHFAPLNHQWQRRLLAADSGLLAAACGVAMVVFVTNQTAIYLLPFPVAYLTAYLGLQTPKKLPVIFTGDYSYGIYLYAFPIQQAVRYLMPGDQNWYTNFLISLVFVSVFAAFSWHCIEKPMLTLKRYILKRSKVPAPAVSDSPVVLAQASAR